MRTGTLATVVVLVSSFVLAPSLLRADEDDWYQGRRGQWIQQHNAWRFRDRYGNEYRQYDNSWRWYNRADQDHDWYQGRRGHWYHDTTGGPEEVFAEHIPRYVSEAASRLDHKNRD